MNQPEVQESQIFSREAVSSVPWMIVGKILQLIIFFSISVVIARTLSKEDFGRYSFFITTADILMIVCSFGFHTALLRYIPEYVLRSQHATAKKLVRFACIVEFFVFVLVTCSLFFCVHAIETLFSTSLSPLSLCLLSLLIFVSLAKDFTSSLATALFLSKEITFLTALQGLILLSTLLYITALHGILISTVVTLLFFVVLLSRKIFRAFPKTEESSLEWQPSRIYLFSIPVYFNALLNKLASQYAELFFLGIYASFEVVGYYALGFSQTVLMMTFLPLSLYTLLSSATAESYAKNPENLPKIVEGSFLLLIVLLVPLASFGFFYGENGFALVFGEKMREAGKLASFLFLIHLLGLFSFPLSLGVQAKEATLVSLPLQIAVIACNILYDYLFIPRFHAWGALLAITCTFVSVLPYRLYLIRRITGGIYFPGLFFLKIFGSCLVLAYVLKSTCGGDSFLSLLVSLILFASFFLLLLVFLVTEKEKRVISALGFVPRNWLLLQ